MKNKNFTKEELIFIIIIGIALGFRQIGMNLIIPFVGIYCSSLIYGTLALAGIAFGIFGLSQGIFQIPFGIWSDKHGYKKMILIGIALMAAGLVISAITNNAYTFITSRALQGSGAITTACYAWLSGSLSYEKRADAISIVGVIVGIFSAIALGGGPLLREIMPVKDLIILSTITVVIMFILVWIFLKDIKQQDVNKKQPTKKETVAYIKRLLKDRTFFGINLISFLNGFVGVGALFIIPEFVDKLIGPKAMWEVFTPAMIISIILMRFSTRFIKKGLGKEVALISAVCLLLGSMIFLKHNSLILVTISSTIVLIGYNILLSLIPTVVNLVSNDEFRGMANGITNFNFYLGGFLGATIAGILWTSHATIAIMMLIVAAFITVLFITLVIPSFKKIETFN